MIAALGIAWRLRWPILIGLVIAAGAAWHWHAVHAAATEARVEAIAEYEAATAAESTRREQAIAAARAEAEQAARHAAEMENRNADLLAEINRVSVARDRLPCLDPDGVRQLNQIGRPPG